MTNEPSSKFDIKTVLATAKSIRPLNREKQLSHENALLWIYLAAIGTLLFVPNGVGVWLVIGMVSFLILWSFLRMGRLKLGREP